MPKLRDKLRLFPVDGRAGHFDRARNAWVADKPKGYPKENLVKANVSSEPSIAIDRPHSPEPSPEIMDYEELEVRYRAGYGNPPPRAEEPGAVAAPVAGGSGAPPIADGAEAPPEAGVLEPPPEIAAGDPPPEVEAAGEPMISGGLGDREPLEPPMPSGPPGPPGPEGPPGPAGESFSTRIVEPEDPHGFPDEPPSRGGIAQLERDAKELAARRGW